VDVSPCRGVPEMLEACVFDGGVVTVAVCAERVDDADPTEFRAATSARIACPASDGWTQKKCSTPHR
jgi:hypothetical protein